MKPEPGRLVINLPPWLSQVFIMDVFNMAPDVALLQRDLWPGRLGSTALGIHEEQEPLGGKDKANPCLDFPHTFLQVRAMDTWWYMGHRMAAADLPRP